MFPLFFLFAEEAPQKAPPGIVDMLPIIAIPILFYLFLLRPGLRKDKERVALLASLKKNDKVVTAAGIYGTVVAVADKDDEVTVRVDDNVRLKMTKASIVRNLTNEEAARAAKEAPKEGTTT